MSQVPITVGLRVQVDISGLQVSSESASVRMGSGPGVSVKATGAVIDIDHARGLIIVRLDAALAGRRDFPFPPERIVAAI
jgi:hypothetical protein